MKKIFMAGLTGLVLLVSQSGYSQQPATDIAPVAAGVTKRIVQCETDVNAVIDEAISLNKSHQEKQFANINPLIDNLWVVQMICKYERQIWEAVSLLDREDAITRDFLAYRKRMFQDSLKLIDIRLELLKGRRNELVATRDVFQIYEKSIQTVASVKQRFENSVDELEKLAPPSDKTP